MARGTPGIGEDSGLSQNDLQCSCCYELMVDPTTLNCGHSFCRFCVAQWWYLSKNSTCPECRQPWTGFPKVNIILRKAIKSLFAKELSQRCHQQELSPNYKAIMSKFESLQNKHRSSTFRGSPVQFVHRQALGWNFLKTVFVLLLVLGIIMVGYGMLKLFLGQSGPLVRKPVIGWSTQDVAYWLETLGDWAKGYHQTFQASGVDGKVLMSLSESDLKLPPFNVLVPYQRRTLIKAIETLKDAGVKLPSDLWEYKAVYPARSVFFLWGIREFPRLTISFMFLFYNQDIFQPLLYYTSEVSEYSESPDEINFPAIEYLRFVLRLLLVPYYLIGKFTLRWIFVNYWTGCIILVYCTLMSLVECSKLKWLLSGGWRDLPRVLIDITSTAFVNGMFQLILWQVMPTFICEIAFYWMLCLGPLSAWNSFKACFAEEGGENNPTRGVLSWLWRKIKAQFQHLRAQRHF